MLLIPDISPFIQPALTVKEIICDLPVARGGGVLGFAVTRGHADFQGRLFHPKYFRQGANLSFN